jgi:hypothetical protein
VVSGQKNLREGMAVLIPEDEIGPSEAEPADVNSDEGEEVR